MGFLSFSVTLGLLFFYFLLFFLRFLVLFPLKGHFKANYLNYENKLEFISLVINQITHSIFENDFIIVLFWKAYDQKPSKCPFRSVKQKPKETAKVTKPAKTKNPGLFGFLKSPG